MVSPAFLRLDHAFCSGHRGAAGVVLHTRDHPQPVARRTSLRGNRERRDPRRPSPDRVGPRGPSRSTRHGLERQLLQGPARDRVTEGGHSALLRGRGVPAGRQNLLRGAPVMTPLRVDSRLAAHAPSRNTSTYSAVARSGRAQASSIVNQASSVCSLSIIAGSPPVQARTRCM